MFRTSSIAPMVIGVCAVGLLVTLTVWLASANIAYALVAVGLLCLLVWVIIPRQPGATPRWLVLLLLSFTFSTVLPTAISAAVQLTSLIVGYIAWIAQPSASRRGGAAVVWSAVIIGYWAVLILHPNVPSLDVGLLGFRKSALCVAGIALGASIAPQFRIAVERTIVRILVAAMATSIAIHLMAPGLEQAITRGASEYTGLYDDQARLQGIFAGPFHVALAGIILLVWGIIRLRRNRFLATIAIAIGGAGLVLSLVRTAFVALALAVIVIVLVAPTVNRVVKRVAVAIAIVSIGVAATAAYNPALLSFIDSILNYSTDTRFLGRLPGYTEGISLIGQSPLFGWGSGSAGDTLAEHFVAGRHITSHNVLLKILVEGGFLGLALWAGLLVAIFKLLPKGKPNRALALASLGALLGLGITVASLETLPISYLVFVLVGVCIEQSRDTTSKGSVGQPQSFLAPRP